MEIINGQFIEQKEWDVLSDEEKDINAKRHNRATHGIESCHLCNRTISDKALEKCWFVHMSVGLRLIANGVTDLGSDSSQGYFPVGSDCAKKVPANFKSKVGDLI